MNIRKIANNAIQIINRDVSGVLRHYVGSSVNEAGFVSPSYVDSPVIIQVQSAPSGAPVQTDFMTQGATTRKVYIYGNLEGVSRPNQEGGDLLIFPEKATGPKRVWKIVNIDETWPDWCSASIVLQSDDYVED